MNTMPTEIVSKSQVTNCTRCGHPLFWQQSYRTGSHYPTEVETDGDNLVTRRNAFHKCDPASVDRYRRIQAEKNGQLPLPIPAKYEPTGDTKAEKKLAMTEYIGTASETQLREALGVIFKRQTSYEQTAQLTRDVNHVGFTGADAQILSDIYTKAEKWGGMRGRQVDFVRKKLKKYVRQLLEALEAGEWEIPRLSK